jgi:hypothetical protein
MLPFILAGVAVLIVAFVLLVSSRPAAFEIVRERTMKASKASVYEQVSDFKNWEHWSPWVEQEPTVKLTFGQTTTGVGGGYRWDGKKTGSGSCTFEALNPDNDVQVKLVFEKPMKAINTTTFHLNETEDGTRVTWRMKGKNDFMGKLFGMLMNIDKMVGKDFERGLELMDQKTSG